MRLARRFLLVLAGVAAPAALPLALVFLLMEPASCSAVSSLELLPVLEATMNPSGVGMPLRIPENQPRWEVNHMRIAKRITTTTRTGACIIYHM